MTRIERARARRLPTSALWPIPIVLVTIIGLSGCGAAEEQPPAAGPEPVEVAEAEPSDHVPLGGQIEGLELVDYHFSTEVQGTRSRLGVKDPEKGRWLVAIFSGETDRLLKVFAPDFVLNYYLPDGEEERATCDGIAKAKKTETGLVDADLILTGQVPRMTLSHSGTVHLALVFYLEAGVERATLRRIGNPTPLTLELGTERPFSVFVTTNREDTSVVDEIAELLDGEGYKSLTSVGLNKDETGLTIHYPEDLKTEASRIADLVSGPLGARPKLKKKELASDVDMILWLGK